MGAARRSVKRPPALQSRRERLLCTNRQAGLDRLRASFETPAARAPCGLIAPGRRDEFGIKRRDPAIQFAPLLPHVIDQLARMRGLSNNGGASLLSNASARYRF